MGIPDLERGPFLMNTNGGVDDNQIDEWDIKKILYSGKGVNLYYKQDEDDYSWSEEEDKFIWNTDSGGSDEDAGGK